MASTPIRYPLDPTGQNPDNLVTGEIQTMPARTHRAVAPQYGAFFSKSLVITDMATNQPLTPDQFYAAEMYIQPTLEYGEEICSIIMITDPTVSNTISLQYQALGGPYSTSQQAIIQQIYNLNLDNRPASWPDIVGKPPAFPPSAHLHDAGDLYGFEYVVNAIDRLAAAVLMGDTASHDAIYHYIDLAIANLQNQNSNLQAQLNAHISDQTNPHKVTAAQVGAYTYAQSDANLNAAKTALQASINATQSELTSHENRFDNPHKVTAAQVGAYTTAQSDANLAAGLASVRIPYTPVQQGGGANQGNNKVYLGWDGSRLRLQVDSTDIGGMVAYSELAANVNNLQNQINGKAPAGPAYVYQWNGQDVALGNITAYGTIWCNNDIWAFMSDERLKENFEPITNALAKVHRIEGVTYNHNDLAHELTGVDTERRYMGFKAGQVENEAPEVVGPAPFDWDAKNQRSITGENYKTLQYEKMLPLHNEAIKEVDLKNDRRFEALLKALRKSGLGITLDLEAV
jgi:hypothetical protein